MFINALTIKYVGKNSSNSIGNAYIIYFFLFAQFLMRRKKVY